MRAVLGRAAALITVRPSSRLSVLGVTGTSGKTTTTFLIRAGLAAAGVTTALIGTVATLIGDDQISTGFTTPEAPELQALLAVMAERDVTSVVMEVSSHALALGRADGVDFAVGAFTNLSQDHLDFHDDSTTTSRRRRRCSTVGRATAVIVIDDEWGRGSLPAIGPGRVTVSTTGDPDATWRATEIEATADGEHRVQVAGPGVEIMAGSGIPGRTTSPMPCLALAILDAVGVPAELAAPAVAEAGPCRGVWNGSTRVSRSSSSSTTATSRQRSKARCARCGRSRRGACRSCSGAVAIAIARSVRSWAKWPPASRSAHRHRRQPALGESGRHRRAMLDGARPVPSVERGDVSRDR